MILWNYSELRKKEKSSKKKKVLIYVGTESSHRKIIRSALSFWFRENRVRLSNDTYRGMILSDLHNEMVQRAFSGLNTVHGRESSDLMDNA